MSRLMASASATQILMASLPTLTVGMSIAYWYKHSSSPGAYPFRFCVIFKGTTGSNVNYLVEHTSAPRLALTYSTAPNVYVELYSTPTWDIGKWHHVLITTVDFTLAGTSIYIDGSPVTVSISGTAGTPSSAGDSRSIGRFAGANADSFDGNLADIILWSRGISPLTASRLFAGRSPSENINLIEPPIAYWPMLNHEYPDIDQTGNGYNCNAGAQYPNYSPYNPPPYQKISRFLNAAPMVEIAGPVGQIWRLSECGPIITKRIRPVVY